MANSSLLSRLAIAPAQLEDFCQRWQIAELALFGSILRADFHSESDVDLLVTFLPGEAWSLWDWVTMQHELEEHLQRPVDLLEKTQLNNPVLRAEVLKSHQVIYVHPAARSQVSLGYADCNPADSGVRPRSE